ncbi:hypothetical protein, partial [Nostoc sp. NMS4]|uniref:hypothetical protein n=1 Tax=Nostoc sp. NMS4 TaxID=2815390 RepID=UPI0025FD9DBF
MPTPDQTIEQGIHTSGRQVDEYLDRNMLIKKYIKQKVEGSFWAGQESIKIEGKVVLDSSQNFIRQ